MVQFEYKVHWMAACAQYGLSTVSADEVEKAINSYAKDGWEYQNTIVNPYVNNGESYLKPSFYLVFRRAKS